VLDFAVTSQTVSPKNAKATAFQFARTSFPCKSGIGGSTGLRFEVPATSKAEHLRRITQLKAGLVTQRTARSGRWTKSKRCGAATTTKLRPAGLWCSYDGCYDGKYARADCVVEQFARRTEHVMALGVPDRELHPNRKQSLKQAWKKTWKQTTLRRLTERVDLASLLHGQYKR